MRFIVVTHRGSKMDLKEAIYARRSVRDFTPEPVDEKTIRDKNSGIGPTGYYGWRAIQLSPTLI